MMVGTSISNEVDGIRAPTMWPTHLDTSKNLVISAMI